MNERLTPETDAHMAGGSYSFDGDFARRLERQRDELREALQKCALVLSGETMTKNRLIEALEAAKAALEKTK